MMRSLAWLGLGLATAVLAVSLFFLWIVVGGALLPPTSLPTPMRYTAGLILLVGLVLAALVKELLALRRGGTQRWRWGRRTEGALLMAALLATVGYMAVVAYLGYFSPLCPGGVRVVDAAHPQGISLPASTSPFCVRSW